MNQQRRRLFVDSAFQGRLLFKLVFYWTAYHVALWHVLFLFRVISSVLNNDPTAPVKSFGTQYQEFTLEHVSVIVCFLVMLPIIARDLLKFSHRFAGPLVRFRNTMQKMADGKSVEPVTLRKYDLPSEFLTVFNRLVSTWNRRLGENIELREEHEDELAESELVEVK